jgi:hypothetical protein
MLSSTSRGPLWGFNVHTGVTGMVRVIGGLVVMRRGLRNRVLDMP